MKKGIIRVGHPVDVATGVQFTAAHDIELAGDFPLVWRRTYSTALLQRPRSLLGPGWTHNFEALLTQDLDGYRFTGHDGLELYFDDLHGVVESGGSVLSPGDSMELRREGDAYVVYHWHDFQTHVLKYFFSARAGNSMRLESVEHPSGHGVVLRYDRAGRLSTLSLKTGHRSLRLEYNALGLLGRLWLVAPARIAEEPLLLATYQYDKAQRLVTVLDAAGTPMRYGYDEQDRLTSELSRTGALYHMRYDERGRCVETCGEGGQHLRRFHYDEAARITVVTDSLSHATTYQYNERGQVERQIRPDGSSLLTRYDEHGRPVVEIGACQETTKYEYSARGDVVKKTLPSGACLTFEYNEAHQLTALTGPRGGTWRLRYERGALAEVTDPLGQRTQYTRNPLNSLVGIQAPGERHLSLWREGDWTGMRLSDALGPVVGYTLDARLLPTELRHPDGSSTHVRYDVLGRPVEVLYPDGTRELRAFDAEGRLLRYTDAKGSTWHWEYSPYAGCTRAVDPLGHAYHLSWDTEGRLTGLRNPRGELASLSYDSVGNLAAWTSFDGSTERFLHDASGHVLRRLRPDGSTLDFGYDLSGNLTRVSAGEQLLLLYKFDEWGQLVEAWTPEAVVRLEYDLLGRVLAEEQQGRRVEYEYGPGGFLTRRSLSGSLCGPLLFEWDARGRLSALRTAQGGLQTFAYDLKNLLKRRRLGHVEEWREHDVLGRLTTQRVLLDGRHKLERSLTYDPVGNLVYMTDSRRGGRGFRYDAVGHLLAVESFAGPSHSYQYEPGGDLSWADGEELRYQPGGRLELHGGRRFERNANGQVTAVTERGLTTRLEWNPLGRLARVLHPDGRETRYGYDAFGRRVSKHQAQGETRWYWAGNSLLAEQGPQGTVDYALWGFHPLALWEQGKLRHVLLSPCALPEELFNSSGDLVWWGLFSPWGALQHHEGEVAPPALRFPGQQVDSETGFHYNRFRSYDPASGRFLSPDPIGLLGGPNLFRYAQNPVSWADPLGLSCDKLTSGHSVYLLTKGQPPTIVYVGITERYPHTRLAEHLREHNGKFDSMTVIATGLPTRRDARNIEGSLLHFLSPKAESSLSTEHGPLFNERRHDKFYYHSYGASDPVRPLQPESDMISIVQQEIITLR